MNVIREDKNIMVELGDRIRVENLGDFNQKVRLLCQKIANKIQEQRKAPGGFEVSATPVSQYSYIVYIHTLDTNSTQSFGLVLNPITGYVTWAAVL